MQKTLLPAFLLLLCGACQSSESKTAAQQNAAPATAAPAAPDTAAVRLRERVAHPRVGDVYVVQFQRPGNSNRYFFYHVFRATPDSAYLHPAYKDTDDANADLSQPPFRASDQTMVYTQAELLELLQVQPGDVNKARLVQVRRAQ